MKYIGVSVRHVAITLAMLAACSVPPVNFTGEDGGGGGTDAMTDTPTVVELVVSTNAVTVGEAATGTFTVQLSAAPASAVLVSVDSADGVLVGVAPTSIQFDSSNWMTARTVTLSGREDADTENEAVDVTLSSSVGNETVAVTVTDNDSLRIIATPSTDFQVTEGATSSLAVHLSAQPSAPVTVMVMSSDTGVATVSPTMLTFGTSTWELDQNVVVSGTQDADVADGATMVMLTATGLTATIVTVDVVDDDQLGILPSVSGLGTLNEGGTTTFTVRLTQQPGANVSVAVASSDATILTASPTPLTFTTVNWMTPQTVTVNLPQDIDTADETASVSLTATGVTTRTLSASIVDNDTQVITATPDPVAVDEGMSRTLNVRLAFQPAADVTLTVTSLNTAVATIAPATLTFTPGNYDTTQPVVVTAPEDIDAAAGMTTVRLESLANALTRDVAVAVTDNDQLLIETSTTSVSLGEAGTAMFGVRLTAMPGATVTVSTSSGDAMIATVSPAMLSFTTATYGTYQMVTVTGVADSDLVNENITLTMTAAGVPSKTVDAMIIDDDMQRVVVSSLTTSVNEAGSGTVGVTLGFVPTANTTVMVASADTMAATVTPATLTFTPANYNTPQNITIAGVGDADAIDDTTTINLTATGATAAAVTVTVQDDDALGIETSVTTTSVGEASTSSFNVRLTAMPAATTTVMVMSSDVTSATAAPAMLTFTTANYNVFQGVTLTGVGDADAINDSINVNLTATGLATRTVTVTVLDDDTQDILLTTNAITVGEASNGTFGVRLATMPASDTVVSVASANTNDATAAPSMLTFTPANYATNQTVTVSGVADLDMANESVAINMTSGGLTTRTVTTTVTDDDTQVVETTTPGPFTITEGGTAQTVSFRLRYIPAGNVTVTVTPATGVSVNPTTLSFTIANYNITQNVDVTGVQDANAVDATSMVTASAPSATSAVISFTVREDDVLAIETSVASTTITEATSGTFGVRLTAQPLADTVVGITSSDSTIASVNVPTSLTFTTANWNVYQNASILGVDDVDVATEGATITVSNVALGTRNVSVTVTDNDTLTIVAPTTATVNEGASATFAVTLSNQPSSTVTVNIGTSNSAVMTIGNTPPALSFDSGNWNVSQNVTVIGASDADTTDGSANAVLTSASTATRNVAVTVLDDDITLTDVGVQMGPTTGGTATSVTGTGFTAAVTGTMSGNAVTSWMAASGTSGSFTTPAKTAGNPNWSDVRLTKGANSVTIPRAHYYGSWTQGTGISGGTVTALVSVGTTTVLAGTNDGVYRSDNSGTAWTLANTGLPSSPSPAINGLAGNSGGAYVATAAGVYTSTDFATWTRVGTLTSSVSCVWSITGFVLACVGSEVQRWDGTTWTVVRSGLTTPSMIRIATDGIGYLATGAGVFRTTDSGGTWTPSNGSLGTPSVSSVATHPSFGNTVAFMSAGLVIYYTTDNGATWTTAHNTGGYAVSSIVVNNQMGSYTYAATGNGIFRCQWSSPTTWTQMSTGIPSTVSLRQLILRPTNGHVMVGTQNWGVYLTTGSGSSWSKVDTSGLNAYSVTSIAPHPTTVGTAVAATVMGIFRTADHGATWSAINTGLTNNLNATTIAYAPSSPTTMYAGFNGGGVWKTTDGGGNWTATAMTGGSNQIAVDPTNPNIVYVAGFGTGSACVQKSTNGGTTFAASGSGINCTSQVGGIVIAGTTLYALEVNNGAWKSTDAGASWTAATSGLPAGSANSLGVDAGGTLYAVSSSNGVYRSTNGGTSWSIAAPVTINYAIDPTRTSTAYTIGNFNGTDNFRRTLNGFGARSAFSSGLPSHVFSGQVAIDKDAGTVYFCPANRGIYYVRD